MQPVAPRAGSSAILFVHSRAALAEVVETANELLRSRRRALPTTLGEVLGIWVGDDLDAGAVELATASRGRVSGVVLSETASLAGIWSLGWFDGWEVGARSAEGRRGALLDALTSVRPASPARAGRDLFFPVWAPDEAATRSVLRSMRRLRRSYPGLELGAESFVDDPARGLVSWAMPVGSGQDLGE